MEDPAYAFTIPSLLDDVALHCRIHHPANLRPDLENAGTRLKAAIVAHPYAPLGGSYDDPVVLSVTESLLQQGYIVGTFNFRGAEGSEGRSSWTGRGEIEDYAAFVGLIVYYLSRLRSSGDLEVPHLTAVDDDTTSHNSPNATTSSERPVQLLLGGYSFGSLILARLPPVTGILNRFETAENGTAYSEIILRGQTLARHTRTNFLEERLPSKDQIRQPLPGQPSPNPSPRLRATSVTVGGEETRAVDRRHSRESKKSVDVVREIPHRIRTHIRRHSSGTQRSIDGKHNSAGVAETSGHGLPNVSIEYLMVSPVLIPFMATLAPPGLPVSWLRTAHDNTTNNEETSLDLLSLKFPTLVVFGSSDTFTSSRRLQQWADRLGKNSHHLFEWTMIDEAGHFWREEGAMRALKSRITTWVAKIDQRA